MGDFQYKVQSGDSLSKIFLAQAKQQQGFDANKKINWNSVIEVFKEIQSEELQEGQRLYRGDNPNLIWTGDKINLSEDQMNRIYTAMGLELSAAPPAETPTPSNGVPETDPNPPQEDTNPPGVSKLDQTSTTRCTDRAGQSYKDPASGLTYKYDKNGYVTDIYNSDNRFTRHIVRSPDGSWVWSYYDLEYDSKGNKTRQIDRDSDGSVKNYCDFEYDEQGNRTREINRDSDGSVGNYYDSEYDSNGNETRVIRRDSDGSFGYCIDSEYDKKGKRTREIVRNSDGSVKYYYDFEYDEKGNKVKTTKYDANGNEIDD